MLITIFDNYSNDVIVKNHSFQNSKFLKIKKKIHKRRNFSLLLKKSKFIFFTKKENYLFKHITARTDNEIKHSIYYLENKFLEKIKTKIYI